ncbi:DUF427 domain-containing protein [Nocardia gamkensis]|jgi:uncharacterized protein (DUF427 family)|uniref:DUF427 domain-containing protein n=1 Tax=Nocardia gamkensis TaxID=352869 RepID=UPI0036E38120
MDEQRTAAEVEHSGFAARPDYRVDIHRRRNLVTARLGDRLVAQTTRPLLVDEQDHGLVFYFPREDVRVALRRDDARSSRCPFKGQATYWRFDGDGDTAVCWSYDDPIGQVARLHGHVAFYQDRVQVCVGVATPAVLGVSARA